MKFKKQDQEMLAEAYEEILVTEFNWKKALATGAAATAIGLGTANAPKQDSKLGAYTPKQATTLRDTSFTNNKANIENEAQAINSVTKLIEETLNDVVSGLTVKVINAVGVDSNAQTVLFNVSGDILAYSQEEADSKAADIISKTLKDNHIKIDNLRDSKGQLLKLENTQRKFKVRIQIAVDLRSVS